MKVSSRKIANNKKVISKKPLTNLNEMNSSYNCFCLFGAVDIVALYIDNFYFFNTKPCKKTVITFETITMNYLLKGFSVNCENCDNLWVF